MIQFIYTIKLDEKKRLVLPLKIRTDLNITDSIEINKTGNRVTLKKPEKQKGFQISKNHLEIY